MELRSAWGTTGSAWCNKRLLLVAEALRLEGHVTENKLGSCSFCPCRVLGSPLTTIYPYATDDFQTEKTGVVHAPLLQNRISTCGFPERKPLLRLSGECAVGCSFRQDHDFACLFTFQSSMDYSTRGRKKTKNQTDAFLTIFRVTHSSFIFAALFLRNPSDFCFYSS